MEEEKSAAEKLKDLIEETVDRIEETIDEFGEKAGDLLKETAENESVDKSVDKILEIRKTLAENTSDIFKSISRAVIDTGESIGDIFKKKDDD